MQSDNWHDQWWHLRLANIAYIGLQLKIYTDTKACPLFSGATSLEVSLPEPAPDATPTVEAVAAGEEVRDVVIAAPSSTSAPTTSDPVTRADDELSKLRKHTKNSLFLAASILSLDGLQERARLVWHLTKPYYDEHSRTAAEVRGAVETQRYYLESARGHYLHVCHTAAMLLQDVGVLRSLGFDTAGGAGVSLGKKVQPADPRVLAENAQAHTALRLTLEHLRARCLSMSWHSGSYPGRLALFLSEDEEVFDSALVAFRLDHSCFQLACAQAAGDSFLGQVVRHSPFQTHPTKLLAELVDSEHGSGLPQLRERLRSYAREMFGGWGSTQLVENLFKVLRDREDRDSTNTVLVAARPLTRRRNL